MFECQFGDSLIIQKYSFCFDYKSKRIGVKKYKVKGKNGDVRYDICKNNIKASKDGQWGGAGG